MHLSVSFVQLKNVKLFLPEACVLDVKSMCVHTLLSAQSQEVERHANFRLKALASTQKFT